MSAPIGIVQEKIYFLLRRAKKISGTVYVLGVRMQVPTRTDHRDPIQVLPNYDKLCRGLKENHDIAVTTKNVRILQ